VHPCGPAGVQAKRDFESAPRRAEPAPRAYLATRTPGFWLKFINSEIDFTNE
jgi:hypothetical protein